MILLAGGETLMSYNNNKLVVPGAKQAINQMKNEIANELGVNLGPDTTSRQNGSVGGEITRRLVSMGQTQMNQQNQMGQNYKNQNN